MTSQVIVDLLEPITQNNIPVITTDLLAQLYGTEIINIQVNYTRNKDRFVEGKHFFKIEGADLKEFKSRFTESKSVSKHTRSLKLWTERGAARHAKMLETDQAWEVFEKLEDSYFLKNTNSQSTKPSIDLMNIDVHLCLRDGKVAFLREIRPDQHIASCEDILELLRARGWVVMPKEKLVERLLSL